MNEQRIYHLKHMLFHSEALCNDICQRLNRGEAFSGLATRYSACPSRQYQGDIGWLKLDELPLCLRDGVMALSICSWEGPFKSELGYHLFELQASRELTKEDQAKEDVWDWAASG